MRGWGFNAGTTAAKLFHVYPLQSAISPLAPRIDEIRIEDIAHHLSRESRFCGADDVEWYSVAEYSILVSQLAGRRAQERGLPRANCLRIALAGLLHDGSEAYFKDLPAPLKHMPELSAYCGAEEQLIEMVFRRFGCVLCREEQSIVKEADVSLRHYEAANIFCPSLPWVRPDPSLSLTISAWRPEIARKIFLHRYHSLQSLLEEVSLVASAVY